MNMKTKKLNIKDIFYFIRINIFIFLAVLITFPQSYSKPIPPGSGEGDVPANILFLLDSSLSMKNPVSGGTYLGLEGVDWAVELSDGNIIVGEKDDGVIKILTADNKKDTSFAKKDINFRAQSPKDCDNSQLGPGLSQNSYSAAHTSSGDVSSNDTVWFGSQGTGNIVGIDSSGECVGVFKNTGIAWYKTIEIRRINNQDILFAWGRTYKNNGGQLGYMFVKNIGNGSKLDGASKKCNLHKNFNGEIVKDNFLIQLKKICQFL